MNTFEERGLVHQFPSSKLDPWIFYSHGERNSEYTYYSLSERRVHNLYMKELVDNDIVCSLHGWLVLSNKIDRRSWQLFNPVSMATIQLPLLPRRHYCYFCALSCDPSNTNCIVMVLNDEPLVTTCYFCRPGDVVWIEKDLELGKLFSNFNISDCVDAVGCYKDQIYIYTLSNKMFLLAVNTPHLTLTDLGAGLAPHDIYHYCKVHKYLVESDGELFVIRRFDLLKSAYDFVVCKLDINEKKKRLVVVKNLGGRSFFLSSFTSGIACSAKNYGIKPNTIYFTLPSDPCIYSFDLQKKVLTFSLPCPNMKINLVHAKWILLRSPNMPHKLDCKVDIISPLQIKKSTSSQPSISKSIGKDWSQLPNEVSDSVEEKLFSRFVGSDWSELPDDALISIAKKLSCVSCACISTVCKNWGSAITWTPKKLSGCPLFLHMPSSSIEVFHFMNKSQYNVDVPENPEVLSIQHVKHGWLLMSRHGGMGIFFLNPLTKEIIEIPALRDQICGFSFTSSPTSSNCSVFAIHDKRFSYNYSVYHIRRGEIEWTKVEIPAFEGVFRDFILIPYSNPIFHKGLFYWIAGCCNLCIYDPTKEKVEFLAELQNPCKSVCISYLFENGEKLMSVWVEKHGKRIRVYELDMISMSWKEVNTLDRKVVFLSRNSSLVTEIQYLEDMICFNRFADSNQPLMYSLKTRELKVYGDECHVAEDFCDIPEYQIKSGWIKPNVKQHSIRELSWYDVVFNISQLFVTE